MTAAVRLRRVPTQARSRERVQRLLDAADAIIGTEGYAALTIPRLAARANVAVGTLYQFFPDKEALVEAVADRYMELFGSTMRELAAFAAAVPWEQLVDTVIERFVALYREHAAYRALWLGAHLDAELPERDRRNMDQLAEGLLRLLTSRPEFSDTPDLRLACRLAVQAADATLRYAFLRTAGGDQTVIDQIKRMLSGYLLQTAQPAARAGPRPAT